MISVSRHNLDIVLTCDPAISEDDKACRTAIVVVGMDPLARIFLLDYWVGRQGDPSKIIETMLDKAALWNPRVMGIEAVAYQKALLPFTEKEMRMRGKWWAIKPLTPDRKERKDQRILSLQPFFKSGQFFVQHGMLEFFEEYETFPLGATKDILDALSYAVRELVPTEQKYTPGLERQLEELSKTDPNAARLWRALAVAEGRVEPHYTIEEVMEGEEEEVFSV